MWQDHLSLCKQWLNQKNHFSNSGLIHVLPLYKLLLFITGCFGSHIWSACVLLLQAPFGGFKQPLARLARGRKFNKWNREYWPLYARTMAGMSVEDALAYLKTLSTTSGDDAFTHISEIVRSVHSPNPSNAGGFQMNSGLMYPDAELRMKWRLTLLMLTSCIK